MKSARVVSLIENVRDELPAGCPPAYAAYFHFFNSGAYYEAHDALEQIWLARRGPDRAFFKALIQLAGAFVHLRKQHERPWHPKDSGRIAPALRLLKRCRAGIEPFRPDYLGVDGDAVVVLCLSWEKEIGGDKPSRNPWTPLRRPGLDFTPTDLPT